jgi:hypothetical protein
LICVTRKKKQILRNLEYYASQESVFSHFFLKKLVVSLNDIRRFACTFCPRLHGKGSRLFKKEKLSKFQTTRRHIPKDSVIAARVEFLLPVLKKIQVFYVVVAIRLVNIYRRFEGSCLHPKGFRSQKIRVLDTAISV